MLKRPEPGTREHILLWLATKNPNEKYNWYAARECPCGLYARETFDMSNIAWIFWSATPQGKTLRELNIIAHRCDHTFGALYERAREEWS